MLVILIVKRRLKMERRGQAALEFLMTYGWAILAAIVVIALLAIYIRPDSISPDVVLVEPPFSDISAQVSVANDVKLEIRNGFGSNLNITAVGISPVTSPSGITCITNTTVGNLAADDFNVVTVDCTTMVVGDSFRGSIFIRYLESGSSLEQTATGSITHQVVA